MRLLASTPYGRVNDTGARLMHSVGCLYVRAGAAVSGCFCGCCDRSGRPPVRFAASGQRVRRWRAQQGAPGKGGFVSASSVRALLPTSLRLFKSRQGESREPESRKVESRQRVVSQSRQSRKSRQIKSRKSRKGRDIRVPTCAKVVKL